MYKERKILVRFNHHAFCVNLTKKIALIYRQAKEIYVNSYLMII